MSDKNIKEEKSFKKTRKKFGERGRKALPLHCFFRAHALRATRMIR